MTTTTIRNGVDVDRLVHTINAIEGDPAVASFTFRSTTTWQQGGASTTQISSFTHAGREMPHARTHVLHGDEPDVLLGGDTGPNAVELMLAALGFCYSVGFACNAAALGYELEALSFDIQGDLDLRNFVGIQHGPRPGSPAPAGTTSLVDRDHRLHWSVWRRRHQARARTCHYRRQPPLGNHEDQALRLA